MTTTRAQVSRAKPAPPPPSAHETAFLRDYLRAGDCVVDLAAALAAVEEPRAYAISDAEFAALLADQARPIPTPTEPTR